MPVKVRCRGCQKVLNAPDRARGKAIKCPNCDGVVRVPAGGGKPSGRKKSGARVPGPPPQREGDVESVLANLDLTHAEDRRVRVCMKCGTEVTEEDIDCPACGVDLETGKISDRTLRKRGLLAPDSGEFYAKAWSDSGRFVLDNKKLVFRTGIYWTLLVLLLGGCVFLVSFLFSEYPIGAAPEEDEVLSPFEIAFGGKWPLKGFLIVMAYLFSAGTIGWYWRLAIEVIRITMAKKKTLKRVNFDFFEALALGCKVFFWSFIFMLPLIAVVAAVVVPILLAQGYTIDRLKDQFDPLHGGVAAGVIYGLCLLMFPVAMVHMSMPYTYKAWLPTEMIKVWAKNIGPALYWLMIFVTVNLPIIGILLGLALLQNHLEGFFEGTLGSWSTSILGLVWEANVTAGFFFQTIRIVLAIFFAFLMVAPVCFIAAVPAVFTMRANGLLAFYRKDKLELIREKSEHEKAGFWVRYLALLVDILLLPLTFVLVYKNRVAMLVSWTHKASIVVFFFFPFRPIRDDGVFSLCLHFLFSTGWLDVFRTQRRFSRAGDLRQTGFWDGSAFRKEDETAHAQASRNSILCKSSLDDYFRGRVSVCRLYTKKTGVARHNGEVGCRLPGR